MRKRRIILGSDHAGYPLKEKCLAHLHEAGYECEDMGTHSLQSCDYPQFASLVCNRVLETEQSGILICGTGLGMSMSANRFPGIRAALCFNEYSAGMARQHNDANILCLGARVIGEDLALAVLERFLQTDFQGGRHEERIRLMDRMGSNISA
jgi:ribose 5-phosphate isomerase B